MGKLRHLDKIVFGLLVILTIWYAWAGFKGVRDLRVSQQDQITRARALKAEIAGHKKDPPERDAHLYSGVPMDRWSRLPATKQLAAHHFYSGAPVTKR